MSKEIKTILIVDDDAVETETIEDILEHPEHEHFSFPWVLTASSAEKALEVIDEERDVSLIISDVWLPGISGLKLFSKIRRKFPDISFILMSGDRSGSAEREARKIGARYFILKPFFPRNLITLIREAWK